MSVDKDLEEMTTEELQLEVMKLRSAIRLHRDSSGHNLCWYVPELWSTLPEKITPEPQIPATHEFLENCCKYRKSLDK